MTVKTHADRVNLEMLRSPEAVAIDLVNHQDLLSVANQGLREKQTLIDGLRRIRLDMYDLLAANLQAWEGEEDSVQEEHEQLIQQTRVACDRYKP